MIPNASFGNLTAGDNIAQLAMQDRAMREQAIRELGTNVSNSITLGFDRNARKQMQEQQIMHDALMAEKQRDLTTKLEEARNALTSQDMTMRDRQFNDEHGLRSMLGMGQLDLGNRQFGHQVTNDNRNYGRSVIEGDRDFSLRSELGRGDLSLRGNQFKHQVTDSDRDFSLRSELGRGQLTLGRDQFKHQVTDSDRNYNLGASKLGFDMFSGALDRVDKNAYNKQALDIEGRKVDGQSQADFTKWLELVSGNPALAGVAPTQMQPLLGQAQTLNAVGTLRNHMNTILATNGRFTQADLLKLKDDPSVANSPEYLSIMNKLGNGFDVIPNHVGEPRLVKSNMFSHANVKPYDLGIDLDPNALNANKGEIDVRPQALQAFQAFNPLASDDYIPFRLARGLWNK